MSSQSDDKEAGASATERYLSFSIGEEMYAIPLLSVREVIGLPEVTKVPQTPLYFLGIMNLRGQVISVMDLRAKLSVKPKNSGETAVIICDLHPNSIGVVVDSIDSVISPKPGQISPKPEIQSQRSTEYITGVFREEKRLVVLLEIARTLNLSDQQTIARVATEADKKVA